MNWSTLGAIIWGILRKRRRQNEAAQQSAPEPSRHEKTDAEVFDILSKRFEDARLALPDVSEKVLIGKWLDVLEDKHDQYYIFDTDGTLTIMSGGKTKITYFVFDRDTRRLVIEKRGVAVAFEIAVRDNDLLLLRSLNDAKIEVFKKIAG